MIHVVLDTNIIVSALLKPRGNEGKTLSAALADHYALFVSPDILTEYELVLARPKFRFTPEERRTAMRQIRRSARLIKPSFRVRISVDDDDNRFLECAVSCLADYIVTGNAKDYPEQYGRTHVVSARAFLELLYQP